jgi:hypothetical protein
VSAYPYISVAKEDQLWGEIEARRRQRAAALKGVNRRQAGLAVGIAQSYPWLNPGVVQSMAMAGIPANTAQGRAIGMMGAVTGVQDGEFEEPAPEIPTGFFDTMWDLVTGAPSTKIVLNGLKAAMAVGGLLYEEVFEAGAPAFNAAERSTEPLLPDSKIKTGIGPLDSLLNQPYEYAQAASKLFQDEFWGDLWQNYTGGSAEAFFTPGQNSVPGQAAPSTLRLAFGDLISSGGDFEGVPLFGFDQEKGQGIIGNFERRQAHRAQIQIPGGVAGDPNTASTLGRIIAFDFWEPDSYAYKIASGFMDFGANVATPVDFGLVDVAKGAAIATGAFKNLTSQEVIAMGGRAGLLHGAAKRVNLDDAIDVVLSSKGGQEWANYLASTTDRGAIWNNLGRVDPRLVEEIARTDDVNAVMGTLRHTLGTQIRNIPTAGPVGRAVGTVAGAPLRAIGSALGDYAQTFGPGAAVSRSLRNVRATHEVPLPAFNPYDLIGSTKTLHDYVRNVKLGDDVLSRYITRMADLEEGDGVGMLNLSLDLGTETVAKLVAQEQTGLGIIGHKAFTLGEAQRMTKIYRDTIDEFRAYFIDATGRNVEVLGSKVVTIDGNQEVTQNVHLLSELIDSKVPVPGGARELKRATSFMARTWDIEIGGVRVVENSAETMDWILGNVWKPFQLITRFAYPVRVLAEEQVRMAAVGMDSLFTHPWAYLQWATGRRGGADIEGALFNTGRGGRLDMIQEMTDFKSAMARGAAGWAGLPGDILTGRFNRVTRNDPNFYRGAATELQQMAAEPIMQRVAGGLGKGDLESIGRNADELMEDGAKVRDMDLIKEWFWDGGGQKFRMQLAEVKGKEILGESSSAARRAADEYIDSYLERINIKTGQNPELVNAIGNGGYLRGVNLLRVGDNRKTFKLLEDEFDDVLPHMVKVEEIQAGRINVWDRAVTSLFSSMMTRPTNYLSRSPFFRQAYNEEIERLMGFATRQVQTDAVIYARDVAKLDRADQLRMTRIMAAGEGTRLTSWEELDTLAKGTALTRTRETLYDLAKRNQFFDAMRFVFPFGDAWKEIVTSWSKILQENPGNLRRFQQGIQGALGPGFGGLASDAFGTGTLPGQGFIYTDPQTEELMFNYPGSELASGLLLGNINPLKAAAGGVAGLAASGPAGIMPGINAAVAQQPVTEQVAFTGRVAGLNLFAATILPGMGPGVQWPMAALGDITGVELPEALHDVVFPYGEPDLEAGLIEEGLLPAWMQKLWTALIGDPETIRLYGNTVGDVARALVRSGQYTNDTKENQQELMDAAIARAKSLWLIRAIAQSTLPTGPSVSWSLADIKGNLVPVTIMATEFHNLMDQYDGDSTKAATEWLRTYPMEALLALQGKSKEVLYRPLDESYEWIRANPDLEKTWPKVIGFFAPDPREGQFNYDGYIRTFEMRTRQVLEPREQLLLSNDFLGTLAYEQAKTTMAGRQDDEATQYLAKVKDELMQRFHGYNQNIAIEPTPTTEELIHDLALAAKDPRLAETPAAIAINIYESKRAEVQALIDNNPDKFESTGYTRSKETLYLRDYLRLVALGLRTKYPEFAHAWERAYQREFEVREEDEDRSE